MYALFAGENHYPAGGWDDLVDVFDTAEAAVERAEQGWNNNESTPYDWYHVVDLVSRLIVVQDGDYL